MPKVRQPCCRMCLNPGCRSLVCATGCNCWRIHWEAWSEEPRNASTDWLRSNRSSPAACWIVFPKYGCRTVTGLFVCRMDSLHWQNQPTAPSLRWAISHASISPCSSIPKSGILQTARKSSSILRWRYAVVYPTGRLHPSSRRASRASECRWAKNAFWRQYQAEWIHRWQPRWCTKPLETSRWQSLWIRACCAKESRSKW